MAACAQAQIEDIRQRHAGLRQLDVESLRQVEKVLFRMVGMWDAEPLSGKLGFEHGGHLGADFEATAADSRAIRNNDMTWINAETPLHAFQCFAENARERAAPAGVHSRDRTGVWIGNQHRKAVRHLNGQRNTLYRGHECIAAGARIPLVSRCFYDMKLGGVNLGNCNQASGSETQC